MANTKKVALVTGANKGLGLEMARQLGQVGVKVLVAARDAQKGEEAADKLKREGLDAQSLKLDVTDKADQTAASKFVQEKFGRLDILINNAGIALDGIGAGKVSTTAEDVIHRTFDTNFFAPIALTQTLLPLSKRAMRDGLSTCRAFWGRKPCTPTRRALSTTSSHFPTTLRRPP